MYEEDKNIYPNCHVVIRTVVIDGLSKQELLKRLENKSIMMNQSAEILFSDHKFNTSNIKTSLQTIEVTVNNLGFSEGATTDEIYRKARELKLQLCPLELGPYLRLQYLDQPEGFLGKPVRSHQAPYGSITIASEKLKEDHNFPQGFYIRKINGVLWLRGYHADDLHVWKPYDHFIFCQNLKNE